MALRAESEAYAELLEQARRCTRSLEEARDVTQDSLLAALARGFDDWSAKPRRGWLVGVARKQAALLARREGRRRRREQAVTREEAPPESWRWQPRFLESLTPSLRAVATLAGADLSAAEIRWLLDLTDAALRQRLTALRRVLRAERELPVLPCPAPPRSFGAQRPALLSTLRRHPQRALATVDPDGHAIFLCVVAHERSAPGNSR